jgi:hypothetical protein
MSHLLKDMRSLRMAARMRLSAATMNSPTTQILDIQTFERPERRGELRETRSVPVEISGFDARGRFFTERTETLDVSESGCRFQLRAELEKNSAISVRVIRRRNGMMLDDPPVLFRVVWVRDTNSGWIVAGAKLQPIRLWTIGLPVEPTDEAPPEGSPDPTSGKPPAA